MNSIPFRLDNKIAVVTGGGSGIGASICKRFASQGAEVYILDINQKNATQVVDKINANEGIAHFIECDVTVLAKVRSIFNTIYDTHESLDILVCNAAIGQIGNIESTTPEILDRLYEVNVKSVYHCLQEGVKQMKKSKGGVILNMASVASVIGLADRFAYSMSKGAVLTMTYSIAMDFIKDNIRCNAIGPARVHTPFVDDYIKENYAGNEEEMFQKLSAVQPIGRMGTPDEIANLALYLCSDEAAFVTGSFYPIDGGFITLKG